MGSATPASPRPLVGRSAEREQLQQLLARAGQGHGQVVVVEGVAGIGKTRLVSDLLDTAAARGFSILTGGTDPLDQGRPFGALCDALGIRIGVADERRSDLARTMLAPAEATEHLERVEITEYRVLEEIVALVEGVWAESPSVLVVDDLHWCDSSTMNCLRRLARLVSQHAAVLVVTTRPDDRAAVAPLTLAARDAGAHIVLGPLDEAEVADLVTSMLGAPPGANLQAQLRRAAGNPLFVSELVASYEVRGLVTRDAQRADVGPDAPLVSLELTILDRVSVLPRSTIELLRLAAVIGPSFSAIDLALLSGQPAVEIAEPLRAAVRAGVIEDDGERFVFRHDLVHEALHNDIPGPVRRSLHRDLGRALAAAGAPAVRVAPHLALGAEPGDREAIAWLHRAGREVAPHAPATGVEVLEQARRLATGCHPTAPETSAIGFDLALALIWAGRHREGEACAREVLERGADADTVGRLAVMVGASLFTRGQLGEASTLIGDALAAGIPDERARLRVRSVEAMIQLSTGQPALAARIVEELVAEARRLGDPVATLECLTVLVAAASFKGDISAAESHGRDALRTSAAAPVAEVARSHPYLVFATFVLVEQDQLAEATATVRKGKPIDEQVGGRESVALDHIGLGLIDFLAGRWDDALTEFDTALSLFADDEMGFRTDPLSLRALIQVHRGSLAAARAAVDEATRRSTSGPMYWPDRLMLANALILDAFGKGDEALAVLRAAWQLVSAVPLPMAMPSLGPFVARACMRAGDRDTAEQVGRAVADLSAANPRIPRLAGVAAWCAGLADGDVEMVMNAVEVLRGVPRPFERAQVCEDAAFLLAEAGRAQEARALLGEAIGGYESLGASTRVATAAARLRAAGIRLGQRTPRGRPSSGWAALTETEHKVALLVAEGLSNPEIGARLVVSRRTIETHVSHILAKLGCVSRREVSAEVARRHI